MNRTILNGLACLRNLNFLHSLSFCVRQVIFRASNFQNLFHFGFLFVTAYVNGQRQGRIMEKPFLFGDCIARENLIISESTPRFAPALDIEHEMNLALDSKEAFQENEVAQKMKELGLER